MAWIAATPRGSRPFRCPRTPPRWTPTAEQVRSLIVCVLAGVRAALGRSCSSPPSPGAGEASSPRCAWSDLVDGALPCGALRTVPRPRKGIEETKTGRERRVVVSASLAGALKRWRRRCEQHAADRGSPTATRPTLLDRSRWPLPVNVYRSRRSSGGSRRPSACRASTSTRFATSPRPSSSAAAVDPRTAATRLGTPTLP